jgi:hypothetical protein
MSTGWRNSRKASGYKQSNYDYLTHKFVVAAAFMAGGERNTKMVLPNAR